MLQTIFLALGCFWAPDAFFGALNGVKLTTVGYSGEETFLFHVFSSHSRDSMPQSSPCILLSCYCIEVEFSSYNSGRK